MTIDLVSYRNVAVIMPALQAKGPGFAPGQRHIYYKEKSIKTWIEAPN